MNDIIGAWTRLHENEDENGLPRPSCETAHLDAYEDFADAVYGLVDDERLQDVLCFARDSMEPEQSRALTWEVISLATRLEQHDEKGDISSTRLIAIPVSGPAQKLAMIHQADGFGELVANCTKFAPNEKVILLGGMGLVGASSLSADTLAKLTRTLDLVLKEGNPEHLHAVLPDLDGILLNDVETEGLGHGVLLGACRRVQPLAAMEENDLLEGVNQESDEAWASSFTQWIAQHPDYHDEPWASSPAAKWEEGLADALLQGCMLDLSIMGSQGEEEMPKAKFYNVIESEDGFVIEGRRDSGMIMGAVQIGPQMSWVLPRVIDEWRAWGCQVEHRNDAPANPPRIGRLH